jgi:hypothetical protein
MDKKIKTSELTGAALDWTVAKAEGVSLLDPNNNQWELHWTLLGDDSGDYYTPSTDWSQGGPIIEREWLEVGPAPGARPIGVSWLAECACRPESLRCRQHGPAPLIAAMRCYVASKLGDEVDIPEELL